MIEKLHNCKVREKRSLSWLILQSLPGSKSAILKDILSAKLPHIQFEFCKFSPTDIKSKSIFIRIDAVIAELKGIDASNLKLVDLLWTKLKLRPSILVVTPQGYQLLSKKRPKILSKAVVLLSELKSLDYFIQLPRLIEDIGQKLDLKSQNERLMKLVQSASESLEFASNDEMPREVLVSSARNSNCGLQVRIKNWARIKKSLGAFGQLTFMESIARTINSVVRNSDRVLHSKEDEFIVFLSNAEAKHLKLCKARLEKSLEAIQLASNQRTIDIPFIVQPLEQISQLS